MPLAHLADMPAFASAGRYEMPHFDISEMPAFMASQMPQMPAFMASEVPKMPIFLFYLFYGEKEKFFVVLKQIVGN
jgi:hypothetical protein